MNDISGASARMIYMHIPVLRNTAVIVSIATHIAKIIRMKNMSCLWRCLIFATVVRRNISVRCGRVLLKVAFRNLLLFPAYIRNRNAS